MAKQTINLGTEPNDRTGDKLRVAFDKVNDNFTELYDGIANVGDQSELTNGEYNITLESNGSVTVPVLDSIGYESTYNLNDAQTLLFSDNTKQGVIKITDADATTPTAQRLIVQGAKGYGGGEGGDVYVWAGPGGPDNASGGDCKIRGGWAEGSGEGGYVKIEGGRTETGTGGYVTLSGGGVNGTGDGGTVNIYGGCADSGNGGWINLNAGQSSTKEQNGGIFLATFSNDGGGTATLTPSGDFVISKSLQTYGKVEFVQSPFVDLLWVGSEVYYSEENDEGSADFIDSGLALTRSNQYPIFNALVDFPSPVGTLWNSDGFNDLTNVSSRNYVTFFAAANGKLGINVLDKDFVMKDTINNKYYTVVFSVWGQSNSGTVTYTRQQINSSTGAAIGSPVTFTKTSGGSEVDEIDTGVAITRSTNKGIYNPESEIGWNEEYLDNSGSLNPTGTLWNADGWANLDDVTRREYYEFQTIINLFGNNLTGRELIMKDTINNKYHILKFHTWQVGDDGGAFSYTRKQINTSIYFYREDSDDPGILDVVDVWNNNITITRGSGESIYNSELESSFVENVSPAGTFWNSDGWDDLSNITSRQYLNFFSIIKGYQEKSVVGREFVVTNEDRSQYWAVKFTRWQTAASYEGSYVYPGFAYTRRLLNQYQLSYGIHFEDGGIQREAFTQAKLGILPQKQVEGVYERILCADDIGKQILVTGPGGRIVIPTQGFVPLPVGATFVVVNISGEPVYIYRDSVGENGTIYGAGTDSTSNSWMLPDFGGGSIATLVKIRDFNNEGRQVDWMLSGPGIEVD